MWNRFKQFVENRQGSTNTIVNYVVAIVVGMFLAAYMVPMAFDQWFSVNSSGWGTGLASIWNAIPVFGLIGLLMIFITLAVYKYRK